MSATVLTSHSTPFKRKHHATEVIDLLSDDDEDGATRPPYGKSPVPEATNGVGAGADDIDSDDGGSLCEDILDQADDDPYIDRGSDSFSSQEAARLRARVREVGPEQFIYETVTKGGVSTKKLATAFGIHPDLGFSDDVYLFILGKAMVREINKRQKLPQYNTIDDVVSLLKSKRNILVITGAGISTSLGIPDFRSKNTGFYAKLKEEGYSEPEEVFNIENFDDDPTLFYKLAADILPVQRKCSPTHTFIKLLQDKGILQTNYTQNIDNIESYAGIEPNKLIQCHGSWATASCRKCSYKVSGHTIFEDVKAKKPSRCTRCLESLTVPRSKKRKPSKHRKADFEDTDTSDGAYDIPEAGIMKPDITFFGEKLPNNFFDRLTDRDAKIADLVIVIGTSMKVAPVSEVPNFLPQSIPHICISREPIEHINFDVTLLGDCDTVVAELCRRLAWQLRNNMVPPNFRAKVGAVEGHGSRWTVTPRAPLPEPQASLPVRQSAGVSARDSLITRLLNKYRNEPTVEPFLATRPYITEEGLRKLRSTLKHDKKSRTDLGRLRAQLSRT